MSKPTLSFSWGDLRPLIEHTRKAAKWQPTFAERIDYLLQSGEAKNEDEAFRVCSDPERDWSAAGSPGIFLVGDRGVYMMSSGLPDLIDPAKGSPHRQVAYAKGADPDADPEWYDLKVATFGGDDGVDKIPLDFFTSVEAEHSPSDDDWVHVSFSQNRMEITFEKARPVKKGGPSVR
ncbi:MULTISPECIES: DUF3085 domain-containing protein [unclassified Thioalkalivibrio]|uniref:DUF3085 domain-containing protein n=1 Tax=unclassified Thioalkalivibrio TaxID=2621013 RepID=UPI00036BD226|nr:MULTISPECIES: DUF3085 domain-containing protein [unclassified Thioalkalivibrio]